MRKKTLQNLGFWAGVLALTLAGFWLRFADLGVNDFQNDEFFHLEAAQGYLETGEYVLWDFQLEQPTVEYERAWIYTWQVAQSFKLFGVNEFAGRLPSVFWGVLLLPLIAWLAWRSTNSRLVSILATLLAVFDQSLIWASRTCRMYSLFVFLVTLTIVLVVESLKHKPTWWIFHPAWTAGALVTFWLSYMVHEAALALGAGAVGVVLWFTIDSWLRKKADRKKWLLLLGILVAVVGTLVGIGIWGKSILPVQFFTLRSNPNWDYGLFLFNQMRWGFVGWPLVGVAVWAGIKYKHQGMAVLLGTVFPIVAFFIFIGDRYAAKKYILFILPLSLIAVAFGLERSIWVGLPVLVGKLPRWLVMLTLCSVFALIGSVPSWPGLDPNGFFQRARADERTKNAQIHNFELAYSLIEQQLTEDNNTILIQGNHSYYWTRSDLNLVSLKTDKKFKKSELEEVYQSSPHGFVIIPKYKLYHLRYEAKRFIYKHTKRVQGTKKTNIEVFQW
ncbi:MAG: phospholipid carrier-dependent glycosyltransferase [Patescibacteria group bacterium]